MKGKQYKELFSRNIGIISKKEQEILKQSSIGIAGVGSDGGLLAERLVRFGIGKILLADFDCFQIDNINRQFGANFKTLGKNKAEIVGKELKLINPNLKLHIFKEGITKENIEEFVRKADVIVDEIDYLNPETSIMINREARKQKKYVFMGANIGWGASIFCFSPRGMSFEKYFEYNQSSGEINLLKYVKKVPSYFSKKMVKKIIKKKISIPSISSSVALVASFLSSELIFFLLKKKKPIIVPKFIFIDAFKRKVEIR